MKSKMKCLNALPDSRLVSEFLILPDGRVLAHNLTRPFAELLHKLNPGDEQIALRLRHHASTNHELPD